jgi:hypothetical protein
MSERFRSVSRAWSGLALLAFNSGVLFVALNLGAWVLLRAVRRDSPGPAYDGAMAHVMEHLEEVYPGWQPAEVEALLRATWSLPLVYEPFTQFRERPGRGRYVNVIEPGLRLNGELAGWPPDPEDRLVLFFGGSTAFGYGVPDGETVPAYLERRLGEARDPHRVANFGRAFYYSDQERALFDRLLSNGAKAEIAVFLDGLNDGLTLAGGSQSPYFTERLTAVFEDAKVVGREPRESLGRAWSQALGRLPLIRLAGRAVKRLRSASGERTVFVPAAREPALAGLAPVAAERYRRHVGRAAAAGEALGVGSLFVLQPVPWTDYPIATHPFQPEATEVARLEHWFSEYYTRLREMARAHPELPIVDCSAVLAEMGGRAYVDVHHYSAAAADRVAGCVAEALAD